MKGLGEPFRATDTVTTTCFQLSISVLISFHLPAVATLPRLVLVARHPFAHPGGRETEKPDSSDAAQSLLLDRTAPGPGTRLALCLWSGARLEVRRRHTFERLGEPFAQKTLPQSRLYGKELDPEQGVTIFQLKQRFCDEAWQEQLDRSDAKWRKKLDQYRAAS